MQQTLPELHHHHHHARCQQVWNNTWDFNDFIRFTSGPCFVSYVHSFPVCADCCYYSMSYMFRSVSGTGLWNDRLEWSVLSSKNPWAELHVAKSKSLIWIGLVWENRHAVASHKFTAELRTSGSCRFGGPCEQESSDCGTTATRCFPRKAQSSDLHV